MADIRQYNAPIRPLRPVESGFAAMETAGRRVGIAYREAATSAEQEGRLKQREIEDLRWPFDIAELNQRAGAGRGGNGGVRIANGGRSEDWSGLRAFGGFGGDSGYRADLAAQAEEGAISAGMGALGRHLGGTLYNTGYSGAGGGPASLTPGFGGTLAADPRGMGFFQEGDQFLPPLSPPARGAGPQDFNPPAAGTFLPVGSVNGDPVPVAQSQGFSDQPATFGGGTWGGLPGGSGSDGGGGGFWGGLQDFLGQTPTNSGTTDTGNAGSSGNTGM